MGQRSTYQQARVVAMLASTRTGISWHSNGGKEDDCRFPGQKELDALNPLAISDRFARINIDLVRHALRQVFRGLWHE